MEKRIRYPFTAIVGQEDMKLGLILNLINPAIGGVLIRGEKGTAKSTAVRGLCDLLQEALVIEGCPFHCRPADPSLCDNCEGLENPKTVVWKRSVVELPVSATEDRVVGSLDIEHALRKGEKVFEPGILAEANGTILYVDEINLLDDHIVDILLDSAAMGVNTVEREGVSYSHPSRFVLVGTMNPEEGDLRPQLLDRFGLVVEIHGEQEIEKRMELIRRRMEYEKSPEDFMRKWQGEQDKLALAIREAQERLPRISIGDDMYRAAARLGIELKVDGHRADITLLKTAQTLAAFRGDDAVGKQHILASSRLALPHRVRKNPFDDMPGGLPPDLEKIVDV